MPSWPKRTDVGVSWGPVYICGGFNEVGGLTRPKIAAIDAQKLVRLR